MIANDPRLERHLEDATVACRALGWDPPADVVLEGVADSFELVEYPGATAWETMPGTRRRTFSLTYGKIRTRVPWLDREDGGLPDAIKGASEALKAQGEITE